MIHHYLQRGHNINDLLRLSPAEKTFMRASMVLKYEEDAKKWGELNE